MDASIEKIAQISPAVRNLMKENEDLRLQIKILKAQLEVSKAETEKANEFKRKFYEFVYIHGVPIAVSGK